MTLDPSLYLNELSPDERRELALIQRARLRVRARSVLADYSRYAFALEPARHHSLMLEALEGVYYGQIRKLLIIAPPGHAKSTYVSIVFPSWYVGNRYNESIIGVTTTDTLGQLYGDTIRTSIEANPDWRSVFPGVEPDKPRGWSKDGFFLKGPKGRPRSNKDATMVFTGAGGPVIGRRASGVIVDDAIDEPTARSELLLEQRKTWIKRSVFSRLKPDGWRILCGTLWAEGDVVDSAMQAGDYVTIHMAALGPGRVVEADVYIPDGVEWRPTGKSREVEDEQGDR